MEAEEWLLSAGSEGLPPERDHREDSSKRKESTKRRSGEDITGRESGW